MLDDVAVSVLLHVAEEIKANDGVVTAHHGAALAALSQDALAMIQAATELLERGAVKRFVALPSQREFFRVESFQSRQRYGTPSTPSSHMMSQPFDVTSIEGSGPNYYNCFRHYCTCHAFYHASVKSPIAMCKHIVALVLGDAMGKCTQVNVQDEDLVKMLCTRP